MKFCLSMHLQDINSLAWKQRTLKSKTSYESSIRGVAAIFTLPRGSGPLASSGQGELRAKDDVKRVNEASEFKASEVSLNPRLHSTSFLGLPCRILNMNHERELLWSLWVNPNP